MSHGDLKVEDLIGGVRTPTNLKKMKRILSMILVRILCLSMFLAFASNVKAQQSTIDSWPMFHHDLTHTGYSTSTAPITNLTLWTYTTGGDVNDPAVVNGVVYIGSYDDKIYALNAKNGALIWSFTTGGYIDTSPTLANDVVYVNSGDNKTYALNAKNGAFIWSYATKSRIDSSPTVADGRVFTCSSDRHVYSLNATNGAVLWNYTLSGGVMLSSPAISDDRLFIGTYGGVYALNSTNGSLLWHFTVHGGFDSSPAIAYGLVLVGSSNGNVYALNASTGTIVWNYMTGGYVDSGPAVFNGVVFVGSADHNVYALNASSGNFVWKYTTGGVVASSPAVADNIVFVGSLDHKVYALNAMDGALVWSYTTGGIVVSSPAVVGSVVYVGSWDHRVYAFGASSNPHPAPVLDLIIPVLVGVGIAVSALLFFAQRRKGEKPSVNSSVLENPQRPNDIPVAKFEVTDDTAKFLVAKGFFKKRWVVAEEIPVYEITSIDNFGNELGVIWKGVAYTFCIKETDSVGKLRNKVKGMLEEHHKLLERNEKASLRSNELLGVINTSIGIIDSSFDILVGLQEKRIDWQRLESYFNGFGGHSNFAGQSMPSLSLDFSKVFSAVKRQDSKETSREVYNFLEVVYYYFNSLSLDNDIEESFPNFQDAKNLVLAYFLLNDLLLGRVVGDNNREEKSQFEVVLQNLASTSNFKVNVEELKGSMNEAGLENGFESIIECSREIFKKQLKQLKSHVKQS